MTIENRIVLRERIVLFYEKIVQMAEKNFFLYKMLAKRENETSVSNVLCLFGNWKQLVGDFR